MKLTVTAIQNAKPRERHYKFFDGEGLFLDVSPAGGKSWRFTYRFMRQQKATTIGPWPMISLADARARALELRRQVHDGITTVNEACRRDGLIYERYDVEMGAIGAAGEYAPQTGFGWTKGATADFIDSF